MYAPNILVVGDVMLDKYWFGGVSRISPEAPVPVVDVNSEDNRVGGAGNVALNLIKLGANVKLIGCVGVDEDANEIRNILYKNKINSSLVSGNGFQTIKKLRVISQNHQMIRIDFESNLTEEILGLLYESYLQSLDDFDVIVFSDYGKGALKNISTMIERARNKDKIVLVDPKGDNWVKYSGASLITPNIAEIKRIIGGWTSEDELTSLVQRVISELSLGGVLLTRSEDGMSLFLNKSAYRIKSIAREVADVTGAGDTVIAVMALMLGKGTDLSVAMEFANRAGGLVVEKFGTSYLTREELFFDEK